MAKTTGHILKADDVKLEGQLHLDLWNTPAGPTKEKSAGAFAPQARITENQQGFAVVEVTCCCGKKTYLRCEYGDSQTPA